MLHHYCEKSDDEQLQKMMADALAEEEEAEDEEQDDDDLADIQDQVGQLRTIKLNVTTGFMEEKAAAVPHDGDHKKYPWAQGVDIPFNDNVQRLVDTIFPLFVTAIAEEEDREALNVIVDFFVEELKVLGPQSIGGSMEKLLGAVNLFLKERTACRQDSEPRSADTDHIRTKHRWISDTMA